MSSKVHDESGRRGRSTVTIKESLRDLRVQLALLNHQVGTKVELKDVDLDCLDLVSRHGPLNPTALAKRAGLHPATITGILDRLERGGWITRDRDPADRRAVVVRIVPDRNAEMYRHYAGMNSSLDEICARYDPAELDVIADFLRRATAAGEQAAEDMTD
ncbi:MarR family transcriptional regulator [Umezawaea sp. Da 62-37]|uniref:MarR family winged helix-turn-helix transcriptional regulator n=1 Tax=Umezawaea sp. Da 62-37 TaxID=3075927 RepID=UPI0028F72D18|nr:MarR family transcriptional regulator [Umezawaea sp. Da 62-37]WNV86943.1 MarR family transcriptional regulator [Umezawaea sp. Da 62-37]